MFKKDSINPDKVDTIIGQHTHVEGTVRGKGCIRIEGVVTGTIDYQGDVVVGETASVEATITGRNITIAGKVQGNVHASGKMELVAGGKLIGDSEHGQLVVAPGALFRGESKPAGERDQRAASRGAGAEQSAKASDQGK